MSSGIDNLASVIARDGLWSDAERIRQGLDYQNVGLTEIKQSRLAEREVECHPGTMVGEYVPFYFCPRSIMLYLLHRENRQGLTYSGGQQPIVHLVGDLERTTAWADSNNVRWAFSNRNAGAAYAEFFADSNSFDRINWEAVKANDFRDPVIKEGKQAEFLLYGCFPWNLIERIAGIDAGIADRVRGILSTNEHKPSQLR